MRIKRVLLGVWILSMAVAARSIDAHVGRRAHAVRSGTLGQSSTRTKLTAPKDFYIRPEGSDSNDGSADDPSHAFQTIQKAVVVTNQTLDLCEQTVKIHVANGTYTEDATDGVGLELSVASDGGQIVFEGDPANPRNVTLNVVGTCFYFYGDNVDTLVDGFKLVATGVGIFADLNSKNVKFQNIEFGSCTIADIEVGSRSRIVATGNYSVSGNAQYHIFATDFATVMIQGRTCTFSNSPVFSQAFCYARYMSMVRINGMTWANGGTVTGKRYNVLSNSIIDTVGGGAAYLPGSISGSVSTQGQYY